MRYELLQVDMGKIRLQENWGFCLNKEHFGQEEMLPSSTGPQGSCSANVSPLPLLDLLIMTIMCIYACGTTGTRSTCTGDM